MTNLDVIRILSTKLVGTTQRALAKEMGVSEAYLSWVLAGRNDPGPKILRALGLVKVVSYEFEEGSNG